MPSHPLDYSLSNITTSLQHALAQWNVFVDSNLEECRDLFLLSAEWLVEHIVYIDTNVGGWPIKISLADGRKVSALSASVQGQAISILIRAYQATQQRKFLDVARLAVETFKRDILDGGICAPIGEDGNFFEELAVYPASHSLSGLLFALLGLYEYLTTMDDAAVEKQIERSNRTMHTLLQEFDTGFWVYSDLLAQKLATPEQLALYCQLFKGIVEYSDCAHCRRLISHSERYQKSFTSRFAHHIANLGVACSTHILSQIRSKLFPGQAVTSLLRVCVPVTAFPIAGGMRTVITNIAKVTADSWHMEYVTRHVGYDAQDMTIHPFNKKGTSPWQFPTVLLYCVSGFWKLFSLQRQHQYNLLLPQDGIFTGFFTAAAAKLSGVRVVCIDHGNLTQLSNNLMRTERINALVAKRSIRARVERYSLALYWPCLSLFAWFSARCIDSFLIPGASGDGIEEICARLGVPQSRLTRFANMIDVDRHVVPSSNLRAVEREKQGIPANALVISVICRLAPEKGLDIALDAIHHALALIPTELQACVRVVFAGDGPLREQLEKDITSRRLSPICLLPGELSEKHVISLLGLTDIFLFTSRRAAGYPLAIMEAMASGCATIATNEPLANIRLLSEGRGIVVPIGDVEKTAEALATLLCDDTLRVGMGKLARDHIRENYSPAMFRRVFIRSGYWSQLDELLSTEHVAKL